MSETPTPRTVEQRLDEWAQQPGAVVTKPERDFISAMRWFASLGVGYGWMQQVIEWEWQATCQDEQCALGPEASFRALTAERAARERAEAERDALRAGSLTFAEFRRANVTRCLKWHPAGIESWSPSDWMTAVTGELGELASLLKMRNRERDGLPGNKFSPTNEQIADELADVLTYLDLLAHVLGVDLGRAAIEKFNRVSERVGFPDRIEVRDPTAAERDALAEMWREYLSYGEIIEQAAYSDNYQDAVRARVRQKSTIEKVRAALAALERGEGKEGS